MQNKEICWNITTRCNQNCGYCHRFLNVSELSYEDNQKILHNLIEAGVTDITWTGGEAMLYLKIKELVQESHNRGIRNKLITNGEILANSNMDILEALDSLTLSIDSTDKMINKKIGRGENHFNNIKFILDYVNKNNPKLKININTVVNQLNYNDVMNLNKFLNMYQIDTWRVFRFMPLRETAQKNQKEFEISDEQFSTIKEKIMLNSKIGTVEYREVEDMENKYVLLIANGDIIITKNGKDIKMGNALIDKIDVFI